MLAVIARPEGPRQSLFWSFRPKGGQRQPTVEKSGLERKTIVVRSQMSGKPRAAAEIPVCDTRYTTYETCGELVESIRDTNCFLLANPASIV